MSAHDHRTHVPGCFRCDLSRDEVAATVTADRDLEAVAAITWRHKMARPAGGAATWCVCLRWSIERGDLADDETAWNAHLAAALLASDAVARIGAEAEHRGRLRGSAQSLGEVDAAFLRGYDRGHGDGRAEVVAAVEAVLTHADPRRINLAGLTNLIRAALAEGVE